MSNRAPLSSLVNRWAMARARTGAAVPMPVIVVLGAVAERYNFTEGQARPGYSTIAEDTGCSIDTVTRALQQAEQLGAVTVVRYQGRGRAAEISFTEAVLGAPNLNAFPKTPPPCGLSSGENPANRPEKTPQTEAGKPRTGAGPTVSSTVSTTTDTPLSPLRRSLGPKGTADDLARLCVELGAIEERDHRAVSRKIQRRMKAGTSGDVIRSEIVAAAQARMRQVERETAEQAASARRMALARACVDFVVACPQLSLSEASQQWARTAEGSAYDIEAAIGIAPYVLRQRQASTARGRDDLFLHETAYG